ncbi:unnamed protein product [Fraxinus pennsylvanica]|uniref:Uncharacterized protein n=1 Tax=Fraxinus pennsylvanica TaxID=56036 RepID=A0AAD2E358_9LAMI|nr:unnamed protein product [Fraxinus pennsylvanica]
MEEERLEKHDVVTTGSEAAPNKNEKERGIADYNECTSKVSSFNGSVKKAKEWKRTLACKLFEERHSVDGGDGMDSLWETYEMEVKPICKTTKKKKKKKSEVESYKGSREEIDRQYGKMDMSLAGPNLGWISKAIKGIGWLHYVSKKNESRTLWKLGTLPPGYNPSISMDEINNAAVMQFWSMNIGLPFEAYAWRMAKLVL